MSTPTQADLERFESLAPWAGTPALSAQDAAWLKQFLAAHPEQSDALKWDAALRGALKKQFAAVPEEIGLASAMGRIQHTPQTLPQAAPVAAEKPAVPVAAPAARKPSAPAKPAGFLDWLFGGGPRFSPAFALLLAVALLPTFMLVQRSTTPEYSDVRSGRQGLFDGPLLRVNFKPQAKEEDIRLLLLEQGGLVVGPTRLGDWFVRVSPKRIDDVRSKLTAAPLIDHVEIVQALPAELVDQ
jgi:hypothetical protein